MNLPVVELEQNLSPTCLKMRDFANELVERALICLYWTESDTRRFSLQLPNFGDTEQSSWGVTLP